MKSAGGGLLADKANDVVAGERAGAAEEGFFTGVVGVLRESETSTLRGPGCSR